MKNLRHHRRNFAEKIPKIHTTAIFRNNQTEESRILTDVTVLPVERDNESLVCTLSYISLTDILNFHNRRHRTMRNETHLVLGTDGVVQSKSSTASLDIFTVEFEGCPTVYPFSVVKVHPSNARDKKELAKNTELSKLLSTQVLERFSAELHSNRMRVAFLKADAPKRAFVLNMQGHNAYYGCSYCKQRATRCATKKKSFSKGRHTNFTKLVWSSSEPGEARTHDELMSYCTWPTWMFAPKKGMESKANLFSLSSNHSTWLPTCRSSPCTSLPWVL